MSLTLAMKYLMFLTLALMCPSMCKPLRDMCIRRTMTDITVQVPNPSHKLFNVPNPCFELSLYAYDIILHLSVPNGLLGLARHVYTVNPTSLGDIPILSQ